MRVLALLPLLAAAASAAVSAKDAHFLSLVYGSRTVSQLGVSVEDVTAMLQREAEDVRETRPHVICTSLSNGREVAREIAGVAGVDNVQATFSSTRKNVACFSTRINNEQAAALGSLPSIQSVAAVPQELKIHPTVAQLFETEDVDVEDDKLLAVEFGTGAAKGLAGIDMRAAVRGWTERGLKHNVVATHTLFGTWSRTGKKYELKRPSSETCDFSALNVRFMEFTAQIRGLSALLKTENGAGCLHQLVSRIAADSRVVHIGLSAEFRAFNDLARGITQTGTANVESLGALNLTGEGQIVGEADTGIDELSCFFRTEDESLTPRSTAKNPKTYPDRPKVIQYVAYADDRDEGSGHGSHVAGTIAGRCAQNDENYDKMHAYNGMAFNAKLAFFDIGKTGAPYLDVPSLLTDVFPASVSAGGFIHSNSWGSNTQATDENCAQLDTFTYTNPNFLALFAAGNEGEMGYFSVHSPGLAKNALTIGAAQNPHTNYNQYHMAYFSSIGPTFDNRIKPEVVAPGYPTMSAFSSANVSATTCQVIAKSGTSMATPTVSGNAALIREYFETSELWTENCNPNYELCKSFTPSGPLLKAMLISSTVPMQMYNSSTTTKPTAVESQPLNNTPDHFQGYGLIRLTNVLSTPELNAFDLYVDDQRELTSDQTYLYEVDITDVNQPLRVTISFYDPPTTSYTSKQMLHDLDLLVVDPAGNKYWGNGVEFGDEYNNNERVAINAPLVGKYKVYVHAYPLVASATDKQPFSMVITSGGAVTAPVTTDDWTNTFEDRACQEAEMNINLLDLRRNGWDFGNYLMVYDAHGELVFLATSVTDVDQAKMCLSDGCYTMKLFLFSEASGSKQVIADFDSCVFLMNWQETRYDFCVADGACVCNGEYTFTTQWEGGTNLTGNFWDITDPTGKELFGGSGASRSSKVCLDVGGYLVNVLLAEVDTTFNIPECGVSLASGETACIQVLDTGCQVCATPAPTPAPGPTPTPAPSPTPAPVVGKFGFDAVIDFTGVTAAELQADAAQQNVLIVALAEFDSHVSASDIKIKAIKSDVSDDHDEHDEHHRRLDTEETEVTFWIESSLSAFGYTETSNKNYEAAYDELEHSLEGFVESTQYNTAIQAEATTQGVTVTAVADDSVDVGDLIIDGKKYDDDDDDDDEKIGTLTRGAFAGVMVAVAVAVVGGGYYIYRKRQDTPEATHELMKDTY